MICNARWGLRIGVALVVALETFALGGVGVAQAQPDAVRVLTRDHQSGGPPEVRLEEMTPLFPEEELADALRRIDRGTSRSSVDTLESWIASNGTDERVGAALFALAYGLVNLERWAAAMPVLERCLDRAPLYRDYCAYWAAQGAMENASYASAVTLASAVDPGAVFGPRARYLRGRAELEAGAADDASRTLSAFLDDYPSAFYRTDVEFDYARALVALGDFDAAARVYHRISVLNPGDASERRARDAIRDIREQLSTRVRDEVSDRSAAETVQRAQILFDRHRSDEVIEMLSPLVDESGGQVACQASFLVARSYTKLRQHADSIPHYLSVVEACSDSDLVLRALYNLGRGQWNADFNMAAYATFERIWTEHPSHSFADDAMLFGARILRGESREAEARALLMRQIDTYPDGDMLADAVWLLMNESYRDGDYRASSRFAEEVASRTGENDLYTRGRMAYFRARSLEQLSLTQEARAGYTSLIRTHPMGYYALLAFNRLADMDASDARALAIELGQDREERAEGRITVSPPEVRHDPYFIRGTEMLRMGLYTLAEGEFGKLRSRYPNDPELQWLLALMFDRVGAYAISHRVPGDREGLNMWYPTVSNRERWEIAYPRPFWDDVQSFAAERELDPYLVYAIMREESGFRADVESWANARGLLQLMLPTANDMAALTGRGSVTARQLFDPEINIELGTMFMRRLADIFDAHPGLVIAGYNGGQGNVRNWLNARGEMPFDLWVEEIPFAQTRNYVKRVSMTYWVYQWLYAQEDDAPLWITMPQVLSGG